LPVDRAEVRRIARLARLDLAEAEIDALARDLGTVLDHVALLEQVPAEQAGSAARSAVSPGALRADEEHASADQADALGQAPDAATGHFRVPRSFPA
jgi:aspartyl-tRNA(Asn)/glutamyl-tRNA(Gln) amidotransferase subunit C